MLYILKRVDGWYVARKGLASSYTPALQHARTYPTREAAQGDACSNEHVTTVDQEMHQC